MDDQSSLTTIERPLCALIAQNSRLPECYNDWDLPESYDHWDLPEVYIPIVINNQQTIIRYTPKTLPTILDEKLASHQRSCWRRHWIWLFLVAVLLVGGAAGGGIAGALLSRRPQDNADSVVPGPSIESTTVNGKLPDPTLLPGASQPLGTQSGSELQSARGTKTISTTQSGTVTSDSSPPSTQANSGSVPLNTHGLTTPSRGPEPTETGTKAQKDSVSTEPAAINTQSQTSLPVQSPTPGITLSETSKPTPELEPSPSSPQPNPLIGQPSKPTRAIHIGRAARAGEVKDMLEIAFFSDNPCDYTVIGKNGDWVCDTPFLMDETVYQWKGCGGSTWLVWGPTQQRFGSCPDSPTTRATCHGLVAFGIWLCSPE